MLERDRKLELALDEYEKAIGEEETFSLADGRSLVKCTAGLLLSLEDVPLHLAVPTVAACLAGLLSRYGKAN